METAQALQRQLQRLCYGMEMPADGQAYLIVRYGQLLTALGTTGGQHLATVSRGHSQAETVLVDSLPARRLERSFHCHSSILFVL